MPLTDAPLLNLLLHQMNQGALTEALRLLPLRLDSLRARAQLLKTMLQEGMVNGVLRRRQLGNGPARSMLQFERGGIAALLRHPATRELVKQVCQARHVPCTTDDIYKTLAGDDVLAFALGRLNLLWNVKPLPAINDDIGSFDYYIHCWNPGAFRTHPEECWKRWSQNHAEVLAYLKDLP